MGLTEAAHHLASRVRLEVVQLVRWRVLARKEDHPSAEDERHDEIELDAARALGAAIGTNLGVLSQEVGKLADFIGDRETITRDDVEAAREAVDANAPIV